MKAINDEFGKYIIPALYKELIKNDGESLPTKLSKFIKSEEAKNIVKDKNSSETETNTETNKEDVMKYFYGDINNRLKLMITYIVSDEDAFKSIKLKSLIPDPANPSLEYIPPENKCFYSYLNNPKKNVILPEYEEVNNKHIFEYPPDFTSDTFNPRSTNTKYALTSSESEKIKDEYNKIKELISKYSRNINRYHEDNTTYYKVWLLFITMSGFIASIFALIFFILEIGWVDITYEEWLKDNFKILISIFTLFILIIGSIIINL